MNRNTLGRRAWSWCRFAAAAPLVLACDSNVEITVNINATIGTAADSSTSGGDFCPEDQLECDGVVAKVCDGMGGYKSEIQCELGCAEPLGCLVCQPGATRCAGQTSQVCREDGSSWDDVQVCEEGQGLTCHPDSGQCVGTCAGLGPSHVGCDFYPVVTAQYEGLVSPGNPFAVAIANPGAAPANITITRDGNTLVEEEVPGGGVEVITLPWVDVLVLGTGPSQVVAGGAYRLQSNWPVAVYQYNPRDPNYTGDASLVLPVNAWTGNYVVASWPNLDSFNFPGWYSVTASADDTTVTLTPPGSGTPTQGGGGVDNDGSGGVILDRGDVLQVFTAAGGDLTGTIIQADKPIQVHGGHGCAQVPIGVGFCDHIEESIPPIESLGEQYVVIPTVQADGLAAKAIVVRIVAAEANTTLTFEPDQPVGHLLAEAGDFVELPISVAEFVVSADKKILVAEYTVGYEAGYGDGDPSMLVAVPTAQFRGDYRFVANPGWPLNFVDIVAPTGASVQVNGNTVNLTAIGATGFSRAHVPLFAGTGGHSVSADQDVGISVYGLATGTSYWHPGGLDLAVIP